MISSADHYVTLAIALDAQSGKLMWDTTAADVRAGESLTVAPLVVKNMVIIGSSGAEYGVRGHIDAFVGISSGTQSADDADAPSLHLRNLRQRA